MKYSVTMITVVVLTLVILAEDTYANGANGRWNGDGPPKSCPVKCFKSPPCGGQNINREVVGDAYAAKSSVRYTCDIGYRIVGSNDNKINDASVYCNDDGTWTVTPTCEPVVCGAPPSGTNTMPVVPITISYPETYTYDCIDNYETESSLESKCLADGNWSLKPPPTCTQKTCNKSALPTLHNADFAPQDVPIGGTVSYTCRIAFRLAPATPASAIQVQTTTCQADGMFTALAQTCVYTYPESCRDYFTRDNLFAAAAITCATVTIDPQGPNIADPNNPLPAAVQCCKNSATTLCTKVSPSSGASANIGDPLCTAATSAITLPFTTFTTTRTVLCGTATEVAYPKSGSEILSMIKSTNGTCKQVTSITCSAASVANGLALRLNGESSGYLYGTNIFTNRGGGAGSHFRVDDYTYSGGVCDCATNNACTGGCRCTQLAAGPATNDAITKYLTPENPQYATSYIFAHYAVGNVGAANPAAADFSAAVGDIECCEPF